MHHCVLCQANLSELVYMAEIMAGGKCKKVGEVKAVLLQYMLVEGLLHILLMGI